MDLQGDSPLQVEISDAVSERDKVKFTVQTKVRWLLVGQEVDSWPGVGSRASTTLNPLESIVPECWLSLVGFGMGCRKWMLSGFGEGSFGEDGISHRSLGFQSGLPHFAQSEFSVVRQHEEFIWLHDTYVENEEYAGLIVRRGWAGLGGREHE